MSNTAKPSRRTVAKSAAWAAPVIAIGVAAPAASASTVATPPGLQGWVTVTETCSSAGMQLTIDGTGSYPDRGLWVFNTTKATTIADATMTFYFPSSMKLEWSHASGGSTQWTVLAKDDTAPSISGMTAYTTRYNGAFVQVPGNPAYSYAVGQPKFAAKALSSSYCNSAIKAYARRSVVVDNKQIAFQRGPISLQPTRSNAPRTNVAATPATGIEAAL